MLKEILGGIGFTILIFPILVAGVRYECAHGDRDDGEAAVYGFFFFIFGGLGWAVAINNPICWHMIYISPSLMGLYFLTKNLYCRFTESGRRFKELKDLNRVIALEEVRVRHQRIIDDKTRQLETLLNA